jgi:hypothetical protein
MLHREDTHCFLTLEFGFFLWSAHNYKAIVRYSVRTSLGMKHFTRGDGAGGPVCTVRATKFSLPIAA